MNQRTLFTKLPNTSALTWELWKHLDTIDLKTRAHLVVVPNNLWAFNIKDDLETLDPTLKCYFLNSFETDFLRNRGPSTSKRVDRIRFFSALHLELYKKQRSVFFVSVEALNQKCPHAKFWQTHTLSLNKGQELSRTDFSSSLMKIGYLPAELVEQPLQYAMRGSIVDFFSPLEEHPVRLELFEDQIQSISTFHPDSQRRIRELHHIWVPPAREFLLSESDVAFQKIKASLRTILDDSDWIKSDRDAFLSRLEQKSYFMTIDYWSAILDPEAFQLLEQAIPPSSFVVVEALQCEMNQRTHHLKIEKDFISARIEGEWVPPSKFYLNSTEEVTLYLRNVISTSHWFQIKDTIPSSVEPSFKKNGNFSTHELLSHRLHSDRLTDVELPIQSLASELKKWVTDQYKVIVCSDSPAQLERLNFVLAQYHLKFIVHPNWEQGFQEEHPLIACVGLLMDGFIDHDQKVVILLDEQIFGTKKKRSVRSQHPSSKGLDDAFSTDFALFDLKPNDLVVSKEHGIGKFLGLKTMNFSGIPSELLELEYRDGVKLFLPVTRLSLLSKHSVGGNSIPLDRLGGSTWESKKSKVRRQLISLAGDLLHLYSLREMAVGPQIIPNERLVQEFAAEFPFNETRDQTKAILETVRDLKGPKPMDRLVCGDVGYGKTEVAIRAAHAAVTAGFQVALLCPTTILAAQHETTFKKRFLGFDIQIGGASRFKSSKEMKNLVAKAKDGSCQILIGTHRLLGQDISFKNLGLLIVDEEQRFGVAHKEKIRKLKTNVHVLSMTATPIPRTLNMAMGGLKELSIITTAPQDRLSVRTHVVRKRDDLIKDAIEQELKRGGQVYYLHNRVQTMPKEMEYLKKLVPSGVEISFVHGQMDESLIEQRMIDFYEGRIAVLMATSIVESGLDVPNANTLIVDRADMFGLSQLYQIRGRVGRSNQRAYAYFLLPEQGEISKDAEERLAALEAYQELGSGFHIASHDLEIRGSGDLLGRDQSGQMSAIGFDAYMQLMQECVAELKGEALVRKVDPDIQLGIDTTLPESYIPEFGLRLVFYRKLASAEDEHEIELIQNELDDRFGRLPESVNNLVAMMRIKCHLRRLGVNSMSAGKNGFSISFDSSTRVEAVKVVQAIQKYPAHFQMHPDGRLIIRRVQGQLEPHQIMRGIEAALSEIESWT
jgi:transcription-repair coupling factor (superfamily II helicase)